MSPKYKTAPDEVLLACAFCDIQERDLPLELRERGWAGVTVYQRGLTACPDCAKLLCHAEPAA